MSVGLPWRGRVRVRTFTSVHGFFKAESTRACTEYGVQRGYEYRGSTEYGMMSIRRSISPVLRVACLLTGSVSVRSTSNMGRAFTGAGTTRHDLLLSMERHRPIYRRSFSSRQPFHQAPGAECPTTRRRCEQDVRGDVSHRSSYSYHLRRHIRKPPHSGATSITSRRSNEANIRVLVLVFVLARPCTPYTPTLAPIRTDCPFRGHS